MKNKWILSMFMIALLPLAAAAQESYLAQPGNGSLFGGKKKDKPAVSQTTKQEKSYTSDYTTRTSNWGVGVHVGLTENDPKDMEDLDDVSSFYGTSHDLDKNPMFFGLEVFYETMLNGNVADKLGFKAGWDMYGKNEVKCEDCLEDPGVAKFKETTYAFPLTVYYKRDNGVRAFSWLAGAGVTIMRSKLKDSGDFGGSITKTQVFPHITVGGEYRFTEVFALGLDLKYNIAAKVKKDGWILSDRSGFGVALTGRFYF